MAAGEPFQDFRAVAETFDQLYHSSEKRDQCRGGEGGSSSAPMGLSTLTLSESGLSCDGCKRLIKLFTARCLNMESVKDHLINDKLMSEGVSLQIIN